MPTHPLSSKRIEADDAWSAIEFYFDEGLTDGLPIVPPRVDLVSAFLDHVGMSPEHVIGRVPARSLVITAEKVAIAAVMAGAKPEYLPVINAVVEAACEPKFNLHGTAVSTGGSAQLILVSGSIADRLGINSGVNLFGPGFRANATIGRAMRLIILNVLGSIPGILDKTTMGHPGKYAYCIAEAEDVSPWEPLRVEKGFPSDASTVTVINCESPHQVYDHLNETPEGILTSLAEQMAPSNYAYREYVVVLCPEHVGHISRAGWSKAQVKQHLYEKAERTVEYYKSTGKMPGALEPGDDIRMEKTLLSPEALTVVVGGGMAGGFSAVIPTWGRGNVSQPQTKRIKE